MQVLLTNDDGIQAPKGSTCLVQHRPATLSDDVWVCAPETEQSGSLPPADA